LAFPREENHFTSVPDSVLASLVIDVESLYELKCVLRTVWLEGRHGTHPKFVTLSQLLSDSILAQGFSRLDHPEEAIRDALRKAVRHGLLLHLSVNMASIEEQVFLINSPANQKALEKMKANELTPSHLPQAEYFQVPIENRPNIFTLYEENIGILTPMVAEDLKEAEATYPWPWILDAFREAVERNKRSWRYIAKIMERWAAEGRNNGEPGRHPKAVDPKTLARKWERFLNT
jgi:DNA replication protein